MKLELVLIDDWKRFYKLYSVWIFGFIIALPDLYNAAISANLFTADQVPAVFSRILNIIAFMGLVSRMVRQKGSTIATLSPAEQAKVALGLETQEDAAAEEATAAQAALASQDPAKPGILVVSPIPAAVQQVVDAQKDLEAKAAGAPPAVPPAN